MHGLSELVAFAREAIVEPASTLAPGAATSILAGVFLWSGIAKLRRPTLAAMASVDFGIVTHARRSFGLAIGMAEFLLGLGLALRILVPMVAAAAAILLCFLLVVITRSLKRAEHFACFCFGDMDDILSWVTLARTTVLGVVAIYVTGIGTLGLSGPLIGRGSRPIVEASVGVSILALVIIVSMAIRILRLNDHAAREQIHMALSRRELVPWTA